MKRSGFAACLAVLGSCAALGSGCATKAMKGTPFYTGEYEGRRGPAEERVNLWPLMYYRDPALSVLWPLIERTEEHFAVRPLVSVEGLNEERRVYNVLWPLCQFDRQSGDNRVFPVFWGDDYAVVFPLYWHHAAAGELQDTLIPLWMYDRDGAGYSGYYLVGLVHAQDRAGERDWHVFPLLGSYRHPSRTYQFCLWPLGHRWEESDGTHGDAFIPLYYREEGGRGKTFYSIPYSAVTESDGTGWQLLLPVYYRARAEDESWFVTPLGGAGRSASGDRAWQAVVPLYYSRRSVEGRLLVTLLGGYDRTPESRRWLFLPLLSAGSRGPGRSSLWALGPVFHSGKDANSFSQHLLPLYYRSRDSDASLFLSLPWSCGRRADSSWQLVPFLLYRQQDREGTRLLTPLYARGRSADGRSAWHVVVPLYYRGEDPGGTVLATLLGGFRTDASGKHWLIYPLLSGGRWNEESGEYWAVAPLIHAEWDPQGRSHHVLPVYYWNSRTRTFLSVLAARWRRDRGTTTTVAPPLLSWVSASARRTDLWMAGGLGRLSWGEEAGPRHVLPLFYHDPRNATLLTPLMARWKSGGSTNWLCPPLLSWANASSRRTDLWLAAGLGHLSRGPERGPQHVFPLFYSDPRQEKLISLLYARWKEGRTRTRVYPPLLSAYSTDGQEKEILGLLGLYRRKWGGGPAGRAGHLLPLYLYSGENEFYTLLFGWDRHATDGFTYYLTPAVGRWTGDSSGGWVFPLFSHRRDRASADLSGSMLLLGRYWRNAESSGSWMFPLYRYCNYGSLDAEPAKGRIAKGTLGKEFYCLPICWYKNQARGAPGARNLRKTHGVFPLWAYDDARQGRGGRRETTASVLLFLYDFRRELAPPGEDYTRARVLWRLWHYERLHGDVSVDVFPAITYDRKADGFKKVSFLWRLFRYERLADGTKKLDLLFLPVVRPGRG